MLWTREKKQNCCKPSFIPPDGFKSSGLQGCHDDIYIIVPITQHALLVRCHQSACRKPATRERNRLPTMGAHMRLNMSKDWSSLVPTSDLFPAGCLCWRLSRPGRRYWGRAGHTAPSAASRDKWLGVSEWVEGAVEGWERKRRRRDPAAAAESLWDPWTFFLLLPAPPPLHLLLSACWPSSAYSPALAGHLAPSPSTHRLGTERFPSLGIHHHCRHRQHNVLVLHYDFQDATSASWQPLP